MTTNKIDFAAVNSQSCLLCRYVSTMDLVSISGIAHFISEAERLPQTVMRWLKSPHAKKDWVCGFEIAPMHAI